MRYLCSMYTTNRLKVRPCTNVGVLTIIEHRLKNYVQNKQFTKFYLKLAMYLSTKVINTLNHM